MEINPLSNNRKTNPFTKNRPIWLLPVALFIILIVVGGVLVLVFGNGGLTTQIKKPELPEQTASGDEKLRKNLATFPASLRKEINLAAKAQRKDLEKIADELAINLEALNIPDDVDIVYLLLGDDPPFTLAYNNIDGMFVVTVPESAKENDVRKAINSWFENRGLNMANYDIYWHIKP